MPMNPEIKTSWGEWLLANADSQGHGALCQADVGNDEKLTFCCLGGLCELAVIAGIVQRRLTREGTYVYGPESRENGQNTFFLPPAVVEWAGLDHHNPRVITEEGMYGLSSLNDRGIKFQRIWALIDAQL